MNLLEKTNVVVPVKICKYYISEILSILLINLFSCL